jgi:glucokinase
MDRCAIGIDLGGTKISGVIMEKDGASRHLTRIPTGADKGGGTVLENILRVIDEVIRKEGAKEHILGVGIGTPGFVDKDGLVLGGAENLPGFKGTRLFEPIRERFGLRATAANDVTATALAELRFGAGRGVRNMVCLALGTGIGGGVVIDNRVYKGTHGMAGELGHISIDFNGLQCTCGRRGCVEQYASGTGIVRNAKLICFEASEYENTPFVEAVVRNPDALTGKIVYDYVEAGDRIALNVHKFVCDSLAKAIGIILNSFAPDRIVLGGAIMKSGRTITDTVEEFIPKYCWPEIWERCDLVVAQCGENAGVLGAGAMVFDEME